MKNLHYKLLGFLSLGIGIIGAFLPLLPTTCFVLLAAWCFAKSSPKWHQRLLNNRLLGNSIKQWEQHRCMPSKAKKVAILSMLASGLLSLTFLNSLALQALLITLLLAGAYSICRVKQCKLSYTDK